MTREQLAALWRARADHEASESNHEAAAVYRECADQLAFIVCLGYEIAEGGDRSRCKRCGHREADHQVPS